jgi:hypothetical protein
MLSSGNFSFKRMSINNPRWFASSDAPRTSHQPGQYATLDRGNVDDNDNDNDSSTTTTTTTKTTTTTTTMSSSSKRPAVAESLASKKKQRKLDFSKKDDKASLDPNRLYGAHVTDRAAPPTVESAATPQRGKDATSRTVHSYANVVREQEIKPLEFWFQVLSDMPLTEPRQKIRDMCREISHSANYVLGILAIFSASVEPERLFRDVGRQFDGRESLAEEQIEAEAIVVDFMKTNASTEQGYCALVKQLAAGVQTHRKLAKEERRLARLRTAEEAASAAATAAAEAARAAAAAKAIVDCDDEDEDADVNDK